MKRRHRPRAVQITRLDDLQGLLVEGIPVLVDFWQTDCQPCRMMEGIVDELADEFAGRAHVVKVAGRGGPGAAEAFRVQSTPTFVVLAKPPKPLSKKARQRSASSGPAPASSRLNPRWRASGLVRKDVLAAALTSNGAAATGTLAP